MRFSHPVFRLKRQARLLSREENIPLNRALDMIAAGEGFKSWSHLAANASAGRPAGAMLAQLSPGDLVLLGARPGHGKTLLGLELLAEAAKAGRRGFFFTLDYSDADVIERVRAIGIEPGAISSSIMLDTSDGICAGHIIAEMQAAPPHSIAVVDYLQLLDQRRRNPELAEQVAALKAFVQSAGHIVVLISQIDRAYDPGAKPLPDLTDVRLPNPVDLSLFSKSCFLHDGEIRLDAA
ncbi:DNA helicase [uncultured Nisaea sp.]|uniref:DNA helicase n=1 Tax=uncultured Nisaea sp. TaxID=538215 RepID=UPI0030ECE522|tara:strand:+ start:1875 stop:2585 length:711 start_codon:yes stop_codon:yes gene_type:complete